MLTFVIYSSIAADVSTAAGGLVKEETPPSLKNLPPSRGEITADTESTITAFTEPPPTDAYHKM